MYLVFENGEEVDRYNSHTFASSAAISLANGRKKLITVVEAKTKTTFRVVETY